MRAAPFLKKDGSVNRGIRIHFSGMQNSNGISKTQIGVPKIQIGIPKIQIGIPKIKIGVPEIVFAVPEYGFLPFFTCFLTLIIFSNT